MSPGLLRHTSAVRIIAVSLVLFALAIFLVSILILRQLERDTQELLFAQQFSSVSLLADRIDRVLNDQIVVLEGISQQIVDGEEFLPRERIQTALDNRIHLKKLFTGGLLVLDLEAEVLVDSSALAGRRGTSFVNAPHFQQLFARGRPVIGPPLPHDHVLPGWLPVSVPVWSESGRPLGVLTGMVDLEDPNFFNQEAGHLYGDSGGYLVIDPDSKLFLAATEEGKVMQPVPEPGVNPMHDRYMAGYEGSGIAVSSMGVNEISSARRVPVAGWFVVARIPMKEAFAPLHKMQQRVKLVALLVMLTTGVALAFFIKRQFDPLVAYADTLDDMTAGRVPAEPLPVNRDDELGRLLHSFNHLLSSVQEAEEKFRGIAEASLDLIFRINIDGRVTYCSPVAQQLLGWSPGDIVGTDFRRYISPEDLGKAQQAFNAALQGENLRLWEITMRRGDGSTFIGEVNIGPIREYERVVGAQGVVRDVSDRRRAAAALAQQLYFQKMVADISTAFIKSRDEELGSAVEHALALSGGYFRVDRAYVFLFAVDGQTLTNTHEWCAAGIASHKERIKNVTVAAYPWIIPRIQREPYVHLPDISALPPEAAIEQEEFWAQEIKSMLLLPLRGPDGQLGFMGFDAVRRARAWKGEEITLLNLVAESITGALARHRVEHELQRRGAELARSNAELIDFAHIASHDLQEPLRKVVAFGDRLQLKCGEMLDERGRDYLARMQQAAERMQGLIEDLLQYSRVTTKGREFEPVDLNEVLGEVREDLAWAIEEAAATIVVEPLPVVLADRHQMRSLLQNLLGNSLKYRRPEVTPEIRLEKRRPDGDWVEIEVSDNGIGFDNKYLDRIFRPFQRLHGRGEYKGSGIGLAVCKKIVERHGGELSADGTPGAGARFVFRLPLSATK